MPVVFRELRGPLDPLPPPAQPVTPPNAMVVVSNISRGNRGLAKLQGLTVRFVARGTEVYQVAGRTYRLRENEIMVGMEDHGGDIEVPRTAQGTLGLCLFLPGAHPLGPSLAAPSRPVILSAQGGLGALLGGGLDTLVRAERPAWAAQALLDAAAPHLAQTVMELEAQLRSVDGAREATRYDAVRRAHLARTYLHGITDRSVPLAELAAAANLSPFQLARTFQQCFDDPPALYHRKLRLRLAMKEARLTGATLEEVSMRFGFAGGSSLSQAWRRTFGSSLREGRALAK